MDRLSVLDAEFLHTEDEVSHLHIAGLAIFAGPPPAYEDLVGLLASKMHLIPRYRQRVRAVPLDLGRPVWLDDPHFDLSYHVRRTALPRPGDDGVLCDLMARLMGLPLDRNRPLWETWLVEGLSDDRWALVLKVHHAMVDGVSGVALLGVLLDVDPDAPLPDPQPWSPAPEPSGAARVVDAWSGLASDAAALADSLLGALRDPLAALGSVGRTGAGLLQLGRHLGTTPPLSIEGTIGPHRSWAHASSSLADVRTIRDAFGGTINDVVLAAVAGGYRALLLERQEDADHAVVRTLVPVSVRSDTAQGVLDNRVSAMLYELPVGVEDPVERLALVHEQMDRLKASSMAEAGEVVTTLGNLAPPMLVGSLSRVAVRLMHRLPQRSVNTVTTNVPGPQLPLHCLGREMLEYLPFVPIGFGVRVGTAILSYNGRLAFGVTGDLDTAPDVAVLADGIVASVDALRSRALASMRAATAGDPS